MTKSFESRCRAEQAGAEKIEQGPEIAEPVFDGGSGQRDPGAGLQLFDRAGLPAGGILDRLRFVQDQQAPVPLLQPGLLQQHTVGGQDQVDPGQAVLFIAPAIPGSREIRASLHVIVCQGLDVLFAHLRAMQEPAAQGGAIALQFVLPVGQQRRRQHQQRGCLVAALFQYQQQRNDLHGLAQPHVIRQAGPEPQLRQLPQPADAGFLIGSQIGLERPAGIDGVE